MKKSEIEAKIEQLSTQIDELKMMLNTQSEKVKIEVGDFAFYADHAYMIIENYNNRFDGDKFVGIRFNFNNNGQNRISWIKLTSANSFSKFSFNKNHKKIDAEDCDLSAFGM